MVEWLQIIVFLSVASMVLGAVAAIAQQNVKRLMAYSSIGPVGYALIGLAAATEWAISSNSSWLTSSSCLPLAASFKQTPDAVKIGPRFPLTCDGNSW